MTSNQYHFMAYWGDCITVVDMNPWGRSRTSVLTGEINAENEVQALEVINAMIISPKLSDLEILAILYPPTCEKQFVGKSIIEWKNKKLYHQGKQVSESHSLYELFK